MPDAGVHHIHVRPSGPVLAGAFVLGTSSGPGRPRVSVDSSGLYLDGKPWLAVMGEIHYSRLDPADWRRSLRLMKAAGVSVVASYVFWIHHEPRRPGAGGDGFDFTGRLDLRRFVETCAEVGLPVMVRIGPWCHGEVRNGGLPDWILTDPGGRPAGDANAGGTGESGGSAESAGSGGYVPRSDDAMYLGHVRRLYGAIARQLDGLLWKDGGPVLGIQVENEYPGPGEHLVTLKRLALEAGLDVPLYTRTGWPSPATPIPFGEILPLFGAYAEGFWARELTAMPGHHWQAFTFEPVRTDVTIGMDQLGQRAATDEADTPQYPYLTCELGGGMEQSYHRRILIDPRDTLAVVTCKLGSGSNLPGYYMFHGGINPGPGLQESQATNYWNDVPVLSYDFQAPLGAFGQVREPYRMLRRLHQVLGDFGGELFPMRAAFPGEAPGGRGDTETLRWAVRGDDRGAFVFVSNYQRLQAMPAKGATLSVTLGSGERVTFPAVTIPADSSFIWPVNLGLPGGLGRVRTATAQPLCRLGDRAVVFFETPGVPAVFDFDLAPGVMVQGPADGVGVPARTPAFTVIGPTGAAVEVYVLSEPDSRRAIKLGDDRLLLTDAVAYWVGDELHLETGTAEVPEIDFVPPVDSESRLGGLLTAVPVAAPGGEVGAPVVTLVRPADAPRGVRLGSQGVAEAPTDADFDAAAVYRIDLPRDLPPGTLLSIDYVGDVARIYCGGRMLNDHFYFGRAFETRLPPGATSVELRILPLAPDAPIHLHPALRAAPDSTVPALHLDRVRLFRRYEWRLPG